MSRNTILVSGGAGFIGSHLARRLVALGYSVRVLDSLAVQVHGADPQDIGWLTGGGIEFLRGSVTCRADWEAAVQGVEQIVHLAAETGTGQSMYEVEKYCATNTLGTALMIDVLCTLRERTVKRVLLASSRSVYGEGSYCCNQCGNSRLNPAARSLSQLREGIWEPSCPVCARALVAVPTAERDPLSPASIYAATKYSQEDLVRIGCGSIGLGFAIFRLQNVYGEGQSLKNPYTGILSIFSTRIRRDLELPIFEDGLESRDFVHVDDVVDAFILGIETQSQLNAVINVGTGQATSILSLAKELAHALGRNPRIVVTGQYRVGDIRHNFADLTAARHLLGYSPKVTLAHGLVKFAAWVGSQPIPVDGLERANQELQQRKLMG